METRPQEIFLKDHHVARSVTTTPQSAELMSFQSIPTTNCTVYRETVIPHSNFHIHSGSTTKYELPVILNSRSFYVLFQMAWYDSQVCLFPDLEQ